MSNLIPIHNPSIDGRKFISAKSASRAIRRGNAVMLASGAIAFRAGVVAAAAIQTDAPDTDSAHIYVKNRWSFPVTQFKIDRASDHE